MDFESKDPENEVIKPTINGVLSIIKSCAKAGSVWRLVFTSSAGTVNVEEQWRPEYDESCWSDLDKKMPGWMYFMSTTLAEKAAREASMENNLEFVSIIPTLVVDPFITPTVPPSLITALSPLTGSRTLTGTWKAVSFSSKKFTDLGFQFKYSLEDMYKGAIETFQ